MISALQTEPVHPALQAFNEQASICRKGGSPFSASLLDTLAMDFAKQGPVYRLAKDWDERAVQDAMALRVLGGLHRLVLDGAAPELAKHYPSVGGAPTAMLAMEVIQTVAAFESALRSAVQQQVQTNEVGRSSALLGGFLAIAQETKLPLCLLEIGSSAGLNLFWDQFAYDNEAFEWNTKQKDVVLKTEWSGPAPACLSTVPVIAERAGCDVAPVDIHDDNACRTLESFVWPDQPERLHRLRGAIAVARCRPYRLEQADAGEWLKKELADMKDGTCTVIFHSIMWTYMPVVTQEYIKVQIRRAGELATDAAPVAWLRLELDRPSVFPQMTLTLWPSGEERVLGTAHFHGTWVQWGST